MKKLIAGILITVSTSLFAMETFNVNDKNSIHYKNPDLKADNAKHNMYYTDKVTGKKVFGRRGRILQLRTKFSN